MVHATPPGRPTEFRYWENLETPWARRLRRAGQLLLGFDPAPPRAVVETLQTMYYDADPLAEAFVDEVYLGRGQAAGRALLDAALERGVDSLPDPPASLVALFADLDRDPDWVDPALVAHGAKVFRRFGSAVFEFAGAVTLEAYSESSVAKPLIMTGAYAGASTKQRFLETAAFWIAVSEPDGLKKGAAGRASALRVRIMHVFVRKRLLGHPAWDLAAWGVPISQGDALLTLMGGSYAPGLAMQAMGFRPSRRDILAMMHFWRYVGHLMGVRPRWFPSSLREATQLAFVTIVKAAHQAGADGEALCRSYLEAFAPPPSPPPGAAPGDERAARRLRTRMRARVSDGLHRGYTRFFLPPWTYRRNRLPGAGLWALHPVVQFPLIFTLESLRRRFARLDDVADRVARFERQRWFHRHMGGRSAEYRAREHFTR
jgi:hypothetical protein